MDVKRMKTELNHFHFPWAEKALCEIMASVYNVCLI